MKNDEGRRKPEKEKEKDRTQIRITNENNKVGNKRVHF